MNETSKAARNKDLVMHGFTQFAAGNIDVLRTLLHEDFVEHNPGNPSGREAFIAFIAESPVARARLELKRVVADDDHVVTHYLMTTDDDPRGLAVVDIWRVAGEQIVEHWDVVQPVPEAAPTGCSDSHETRKPGNDLVTCHLVGPGLPGHGTP